MIDHSSNEYPTNNTPLASHLLTEGYPLKDIVFEGPIAYFIFSKKHNGIEACAHDFTILNAKSSNAARLIENFRSLVARSKKGY